MQKPVVFKSGKYDVYGVLHLPSAVRAYRSVPAVIFCHGFGGTKVGSHRIFVKMARVLEKHRIASLRFDFRGCGDSGGDFINSTISGYVKDAASAVDFAVSQYGINKTRAGLLGLSLGAVVASYIAGRNLRIKALALWSPVGDLLEEVQQIKKTAEFKRIKRLKAIDYHGNLLGKPSIDEISEVHPTAKIQEYCGNTVIIQGTKDRVVPLSHSMKYYRVLKQKGLPVERLLIQGADHTFSSYQWEQEVIQKTLKFFVKNL